MLHFFCWLPHRLSLLISVSYYVSKLVIDIRFFVGLRYRNIEADRL